MRLLPIILAALIFASGIAFGQYLAHNKVDPWVDTPNDLLQAFNPLQSAQPRANPQDRIAEKQIEVYGDRIILDIQNAQWARFADTKSMEPVLSAGANAIELTPESEDDVQVGDIVSYKSEYADGYIIHRVVQKGQDEQGTYYILKGDNLATSDPGRVRFDQIKSVVVAIIY